MQHRTMLIRPRISSRSVDVTNMLALCITKETLTTVRRASTFHINKITKDTQTCSVSNVIKLTVCHSSRINLAAIVLLFEVIFIFVIITSNYFSLEFCRN